MTTLTPRIHTAGRSRLVAYDHGAHLAEWTVDGITRVWVSEHAVLDGSRSIRGGVPICFPWFADGPQGDLEPSHGLVRTASWATAPTDDDEVWAWQLDSEEVADQPGAEHIPGPFRVRYSVSVAPDGAHGDEVLTLTLRVTNTGDVDYAVEAALHTYLGVEDVRQVRVLGLEGADYLDKVTGRREVQEGPLVMEGATDRVYDRSGPVIVEDRAALLHHEVRPSGATQTVVWNPWDTGAEALSDLGDDEWMRFVCVETVASAGRALHVAAGATVEVSCSLSQHRSPTT